MLTSNVELRLRPNRRLQLTAFGARDHGYFDSLCSAPRRQLKRKTLGASPSLLEARESFLRRLPKIIYTSTKIVQFDSILLLTKNVIFAFSITIRVLNFFVHVCKTPEQQATETVYYSSYSSFRTTRRYTRCRRIKR
jgi:hypothetical protein